jgi:hypothetical protein
MSVKSKDIHGVNKAVIFITSQRRRTGVCEGTVVNTNTQTQKTHKKAKQFTQHSIKTFVIDNA